MDDQLRLTGTIDTIVTAALLKFDFQIQAVVYEAANPSAAVVFYGLYKSIAEQLD